MSTHKTTADQGVILDFLKESFSKDISNLEMIIGGEGSQAYSFSISGVSYIIRVNKHHTLGFRKDEYAFTNYSSSDVPIPEIYKIGKINSDLRFCISKKVEGKVLSSFSNKEVGSLLPDLFEVLDAIHSIDVSNTNGYGKWKEDGQADYKSWKDHLLSVDKYAKGEDGSSGLFESTFLEKDFWDPAYLRLVELLDYCPESRFLVHGDCGFDNILSDGKSITGVIDWAESKYGDFLFDIAWLSFWSQSTDYQNLYLEHSKNKGVQIENYSERILCYKLFIGLSSLSFYAYSGQEDKYKKTKEAIRKLIL